MGKPMMHMIPGQETRVRDRLSSSKSTTNSVEQQYIQAVPGMKNAIKNGSQSTLTLKGKQHPSTSRTWIKGNGVKRSPTNASIESNTTSKSNSSNESGLLSFVHSNASLSSSPSSNSGNHNNNEMHSALSRGESSSHATDITAVVTNKNALVPESIMTSAKIICGCSTQVSSSSKVRIAIENYEDTIEITRHKSNDLALSGKKRLSVDEREPSILSWSPSQSLMSKTNKTSRNHNKFAEKAAKGYANAFTIPENALASSGRQNGIEVELPSKQELPNFSATHPRSVVTRQNQRSTKSRRHRRRSTSAGSIVTKTTSVTSSSLFFSAMDKHVATRRSNKPFRRLPKLQVPQPQTSISTQKKMYKIVGGELVVNEVDEFEQAIEVKYTGSVIVDQLPHQPRGQEEEKYRGSNTPSTLKTAEEETVKTPYRLIRSEESNDGEVLRNTPCKTPSKSLFRVKTRRLKNTSPSVVCPRNPIKVISDDKHTDAIELLRINTDVGGSSDALSYDNNEEDLMIKRVGDDSSPPQSPTSPVESLRIVGKDNIIEIVVPSSKQGKNVSAKTMLLPTDEHMEKIVSIRNLCSQDECIESSSSVSQIKIVSPVSSPLSKEKSVQPKNFEPVVEIPSNRVEKNAIDVTKSGSYSIESISSIASISPTEPTSCATSCHVKSNSSQMNKAVKTEVKAPENGDQLVFIGREHATPKIAKAVLVPKIPAPKKDTNCKNSEKINKTLPYDAVIDGSSSIEGSRKVRTRVQPIQKDSGNIKNIEIASVATPESSKQDRKVLSVVKTYSANVVEKPLPTLASKQETSSSGTTGLSESKHVVYVNVLGVAGIVVDRKNCRDVTGNNRSPSPPEQMAVVVGISESGQKSIDNVTIFSGALIHAPNTNAKNDGKTPKTNPHNEAQRHIAVWASTNHRGKTPGSVVESKLLNLKTINKRDQNSKNIPKFLDLNVALVKSGKDIHHAAVVIGTARIEITDEMMRGSDNGTIDVPVDQIVHAGPSSSIDRNRVILLRTASTQGTGDRKLYVEQHSDREVNGNQEDLTSVYAIDPAGDSMIRVQVHVEEVQATSKKERSIHRMESFANRTAATERSDESSIPSIASPKDPRCNEMYSKPLDFPSPFVDDDATFHTVSWKGKLLASNEATNAADLPGCQIFGTKIGIPSCTSESKTGLARRIDDRIEDMAEHVFSKTCPAPSRDDCSLLQDDTFTTANNTHYTGATGTIKDETTVTQRKLIEEMVPTLHELRSLAKELFLSSGEYLFPENTCITPDRVLAVDDEDDDNTSVGSATLVAFERGELMSRDSYSRESWTKKRADDNATYSTGGSDDETEVSIARNNQSLFDQEVVQFGSDGKRGVMSENNKFDIDTGNHNHEGVGDSRAFDGYPGAAAQLDMGCEGDDEESTLEDRTALIDEDNNDHDLRRQSSGKPSVVENIAEVFSIGACRYFSAENVNPGVSIWSHRSATSVEIPKTVDQTDLHSVGELTAITLEKNEMREKSRKLLMSRLGLPNEILTWSIRGRATKANAGDGKDAEEVQGSNSGIVSDKQPEDYFAEYEKGTSDVRSIYGNDDVEEVQRAREDPPAENSTKESSQSTPDSCMPKIQEEDESEVQSA